MGRVNTYLIWGRPWGLIDAGVRSDRSLAELEAALATRGLDPSQLGALALTHQHTDHSGAAVELARRSSAPLWCHRVAARDTAVGRKAFLELLSRYGAPPRAVEGLATAWAKGDHFGEALTEAPTLKLLEDGDRFELGALTLEVLHTPGHSPDHICLLAREAGALFCGDLLLARVTSNPLPHFDARSPRGRRPSLKLYLESLSRVEALGPKLGLPGHGPPLPDTAAAAATARGHILARNDKVLRLIRKLDGRSLFELATRFFSEAGVTGQALAFCELLAHGDLLEDRGLVTVSDTDGTVRCR